MKKTYVPQGEATTYMGFVLVARQQKGNMPTCEGCFFTDTNLKKHGMKRMACHKHNLACTPYTRKDNSHVIFKQKP